MKNLLLLMILLGLSIPLSAQNDVGIIRPGNSFQNPYTYDLFYMPRAKVLEYKNLSTKAEFDSLKINKYQELVKTYEERIFLADSASRIKQLEANFWHEKLLANDLLLEEEKKKNIQLRADVEQAKRSRMYYFVAGIVATAVTVGILD